jgi:hypothetical protein
MPEWGKIFEREESDFGGQAQAPSKYLLPMEWVPQVPRIWERQITDPNPAETDHDQSR